MRTRNQSKQQNHSSDKDDATNSQNDGSGTLAEISREAVGKLLRRANPRRTSGIRKQDSCSQQCESTGLSGSKRSEIQDRDGRVTWNALDSESCGKSAIGRSVLEKEDGGKSSQDTFLNSGEEIVESDWEDGTIPTLDSVDNHQNAWIKEVTVELSGLPDSSHHKPIRRASAEDKELSELVHKVHLLCLLARGRLIDSACNDPFIQASLLSLLPADLLKISEIPRLTAKAFTLLVHWFHDNFHVRSPSNVERPLHSSLAFALEAHEGTPEEIAALSVALFRALNLATRLSREFDPIQMGLGVGSALNEPNQRQANWIPISWETSMGGPLGEVLHNTDNNGGDCKNTSALNLMTEGWDGSPRLGSSPTGVLQKTSFGSLSNSSAGSSPNRKFFFWLSPTGVLVTFFLDNLFSVSKQNVRGTDFKPCIYFLFLILNTN